MKAYVTKYCLTGPIAVTTIAHQDGRYTWVNWPGGLNGMLMLNDSEWAENEEGARVQAERKRKRRIESLKKAMRKVEDREFTFMDAK